MMRPRVLLLQALRPARSTNDLMMRQSRSYRLSTPRKLPTLPASIQTKRASARPLPKIPQPLICKTCGTCITSQNVLFPESDLPHGSSLAFRGFSGKASLFTEAYNIHFAPPNVQLMMTGAHTMQELTCSSCSTYMGWKIVRAHEKSESWKDGSFLLELEHLYFQPAALEPIDDSSNHWQTSSSNSDSDHSPR